MNDEQKVDVMWSVGRTAMWMWGVFLVLFVLSLVIGCAGFDTTPAMRLSFDIKAHVDVDGDLAYPPKNVGTDNTDDEGELE